MTCKIFVRDSWMVLVWTRYVKIPGAPEVTQGGGRILKKGHCHCHLLSKQAKQNFLFSWGSLLVISIKLIFVKRTCTQWRFLNKSIKVLKYISARVFPYIIQFWIHVPVQPLNDFNLVPRVFYWVLSYSLEKDPGCMWSRVYDQNYCFREGRPYQSFHVLVCVSPRFNDVEEYLKIQWFSFLFSL